MEIFVLSKSRGCAIIEAKNALRALFATLNNEFLINHMITVGATPPWGF